MNSASFSFPAPAARSRETDGFFPNVVSSNGLVTRENGFVFIGYGACDESTCLLEATVAELLESLDAV